MHSFGYSLSFRLRLLLLLPFAAPLFWCCTIYHFSVRSANFQSHFMSVHLSLVSIFSFRGGALVATFLSSPLNEKRGKTGKSFWSNSPENIHVFHWTLHEWDENSFHRFIVGKWESFRWKRSAVRRKAPALEGFMREMLAGRAGGAAGDTTRELFIFIHKFLLSTLDNDSFSVKGNSINSWFGRQNTATMEFVRFATWCTLCLLTHQPWWAFGIGRRDAILSSLRCRR